eukprot:9293794-Prorocentrum_lima.AAC.1
MWSDCSSICVPDCQLAPNPGMWSDAFSSCVLDGQSTTRDVERLVVDCPGSQSTPGMGAIPLFA